VITVFLLGRTVGTAAAQHSSESILARASAIERMQMRIDSLLLVDNFDELTEAEYEIIVADHEAFINALAGQRILDTRIISLIPGISETEINLLGGSDLRVDSTGDWKSSANFMALSVRTALYLSFAHEYVKSVAMRRQPSTTDNLSDDLSASEEEMSARSSHQRSQRRYGRVILRIEKSDNSSSDKHRGFLQSLRTTAKISFRTDHFTSSITARNDPSEPFQWRPDLGWYGFDHISGHLQWRPADIPVEITIGHFSLDYGQGLIWSRPFGQRRDVSAPHRALRRSSGVRGHASASGSAYLTGLASKFFAGKNTQLVLFLSQRKYDGRLIESACETECTGPRFENVAWQFSPAGVHVTDDQLFRKNSVRSRVTGIVLEQRFSTFLAGASLAKTTFDKPFKWQQRTGASLSLYSSNFFGAWTAGHLTVSGELSLDDTNVSGGVLGAVIRPEKHLQGILLFRYYDGQRMGLHSGASGFSASLEQQWGMLLGWKFTSRNGWKLSASIEYHTGQDHDWSFPSRRYGTDVRIFAEINPVRRARFRIYLKQKRALRTFSESSPLSPSINYPEIASTEQFSAELLYELSPRLQTRLRTDANVAMMGSANLGNGFQVYQQFDVKVSNRFSFAFRASVFESDNSLNRIYVYEPDVSGKLIAPSNSGSGYNLMLLARALNFSGVRLEMKLSHRSYSTTLSNLSVNTIEELEYRSQQQVTIQITRGF